MARKKQPAKKVEEFADGTYDLYVKSLKKENVEVTITRPDEVPDPEPNGTGSIALDYDLICPVPEGEMIEIIGDEGSGKTTLALECLASAFNKGKTVQYTNMERNLHGSLIRSIRGTQHIFGEDGKIKKEYRDRYMISRPENGEAALQSARVFVEMFPKSVVVIDSVDACVPKEVLAGAIGDAHVGNAAKLMSEALRILVQVAHSTQSSIIFINQFRSKIMSYGDPRTPSGGGALKYYCSQRIALKKPAKDDAIKNDDGTKIGHMAHYTIMKNKSAPDGIKGYFSLLYGYGIYREQHIIAACLRYGILSFGGRGGKQVVLPVIDANGQVTIERTLKQTLAARYLISDPRTSTYYENEILKLTNTKFEPELDEIPEP